MKDISKKYATNCNEDRSVDLLPSKIRKQDSGQISTDQLLLYEAGRSFNADQIKDKRTHHNSIRKSYLFDICAKELDC